MGLESFKKNLFKNSNFEADPEYYRLKIQNYHSCKLGKFILKKRTLSYSWLEFCPIKSEIIGLFNLVEESIEGKSALTLKLTTKVSPHYLSSLLNVTSIEYYNNDNMDIETDFWNSAIKSLSDFTFTLIGL